MATVTYDGRGFMLDGRRIWIVSGSIHHGRIAPECWADRIHAAKLAGVNTIETPIFWNRVEPRAGQFDFTGENDIRAFVRLCGEAGMHVILRPGPYVGQGWDLGGLPAWLLATDGVQPRTANAPFLDACSRYISALADQIKDLQVTATGGGGPILLIQSEHEWTCGDDAIAQGYLGELQRYMRESGLSVPIINANLLWQGLEGQIECWSGDRNLYAMMRQLGHVSPEQPKLVIDFGRASPSAALGAPAEGTSEDEPAELELADPFLVQRRGAEAIAAGGQINVSPFASGTSFGFFAGQLPTGNTRFLGPTQDPRAPLAEDGTMSPYYGPMRRLLHFSRSLSRTFAHVDADANPVILDPSEHATEGLREGRGMSIVPVSGTQGSVTFVFRPATLAGSKAHKPGEHEVVPLLGPDGSTLHVPMGEQLVYWCVHNALLSGRAMLDYASLCVFGFQSDMLVAFGPAGALGELSINGTPLEVEVPPEGEAVVELHKEVTVVVVAERTVDRTFFGEHSPPAESPDAGDGGEDRRPCVYVGVSHVTGDGRPVPTPGEPYTVVTQGGEIDEIAPAGAGAVKRKKTKTSKVSAAKTAPPKVTLEQWHCATNDEHREGTSPRYAAIDGPGDMGELGAGHGYGWYRASLKVGATKKVRLGDVGIADRAQLLIDGQTAGVLGRGPGATRELPVSLKKGARTLILLADNMGRVSGGSAFHDPKGITRHLAEVAPLKLDKPALVEDDPLDPLDYTSPCFGVRRGDVTSSLRVVWTFQHRRKTALELSLGPVPCRGVLVVNGEFERYMDAGTRLVTMLDEDRLSRGTNELSFMPMADDVPSEDDAWALADALAAACEIREVVSEVTTKAEWSFAKWEPPAPAAFEPVAKSALGGRVGPTWWRVEFHVTPESHAPLAHDGRLPVAVDLAGMTKGQVYLNGKHVGRYFHAAADGEPLPSARPVVLPEAWMSVAGAANTLMLFDEHGGNPGRVKLQVSGDGPVVRAKL